MPIVNIIPGKYSEYRPEESVITYSAQQITTPTGKAMLLHEVAHALLNHEPNDENSRYAAERSAWQLAQRLGLLLGAEVKESVVYAALKQIQADGYRPDLIRD